MAKKNIKKDIENLLTSNLADFEKGLSRILKQSQTYYTEQQLINKLIKANTSLTGSLTNKQKKHLENKINELKANKSIYNVEKKRREILKDIGSELVGSLKSAYDFLNTVDGAIKSSALNLGLSRALSEQYRDNLIGASQYAARLGLSVESLTRAQMAYNAEVGTSVILSTKSLEAVAAITQGTAMSADEAGTLVGQFKLLGKNASGVKAFIEDTAVESNNMGVNMNKVLKDISGNFSQIQSYNFSNGIKGIQEMAINAAKYKMNITDAFAAIDKSRTLEGAVEMSAKLMVMGGEFSKQNMFEIAFMARNKPEDFIKKMGEMTKGVYFFNKQTGEFQSTAFDLDRLRAVSEATGIPFEKLSETARRLAETNLAKTQLGAMSPEDKEMIANMAEMNNGKFTIKLGSDVVDIKNIGASQIALLKEQNVSLEKRAKDALTFDQEVSTLIAEAKSIILPFLRTMNSGLRLFQEATESMGGIGRAVLGGLSLLLMGSLPKLITSLVGSLVGKSVKDSVAGSIGSSGGGTAKKGGGFMGNLGKMAGGAVAVGGAFLAASYGIKMIAESFKELNPEQLNAVTAAIVTMGISIPVSLFAISSAGMAATAAAPGLGFLALTIGSIGLAAMGIGKGIEFASNGLSKLLSSLTAKELLLGLGSIAIGLTGIGLSLMTFTKPTTIAGIAGLVGLLGTLTLFKGTLSNLSTLSTSMANGTQGFIAFGNAISKVSELTNNDKTIKELRQLISDLNNMKISNPINELKEILSKPLKVEFDSQNVSMVVNLTSHIDGEKLASSMYTHLVKLGINKSKNK